MKMTLQGLEEYRNGSVRKINTKFSSDVSIEYRDQALLRLNLDFVSQIYYNDSYYRQRWHYIVCYEFISRYYLIWIGS